MTDAPGSAGPHPPPLLRESLHLRADLEELERLGDWVRNALAPHYPKSLVHDVEFCLTELVTNTISYGFDDPGGQQVGVFLEGDETAVHVTVEDTGKPFNPLEHEAAARPARLEDAPIGGLGIDLLRSLCDHAAYARDRGTNRFTFTRLRASCPEA